MHWEWLFCRNKGLLRWNNYQSYIVAAIVLGTLDILGYEANKKINRVSADKVATSVYQWNKGMSVEVEWQGKWYKAKIIDVHGKLFKIHYENYDNSWDEWVESTRIRSRLQ